jgi:tetratricopeptide (TPR) repeat protein
MDLVTFAMVLVTAVTAVGLDTVWHQGDVVLETVTTGPLGKTSMDSGLARTIVENEAQHVFATPSLVSKPQLRWTNQGGIGAAIAEATGLQTVAYAVQAQFGFQPDDYRLALFSEDGLVKVLITGQSRRTPSAYSQVVVQDPGESVVDLIRRATLVGLAHIDPYLTALHQVAQQNAAGENADAERIIGTVMPHLADTPRNPERALFENLRGLLALLRQDPEAAHDAFENATASDPDNVAAALNVAFTDIQLNRATSAAARMRTLVEAHRPADKVLLATAYVTWAAARMGLQDLDEAEMLVSTAAGINPDSRGALELWADLRGLKGDAAGAERLRLKARQSNAAFENYAEIASLYFQLAWRDNHKLTRSRHGNADTVSLP